MHAVKDIIITIAKTGQKKNVILKNNNLYNYTT